jgi:hypothetical protein
MERLTRLRIRAGLLPSPKSPKSLHPFSFDRSAAQLPTGSAKSTGGSDHGPPQMAAEDTFDEEDTGGSNSAVSLVEDIGEVFKEGILGMRPPNGGDFSSWPKFLFRLREASLVAISVDDSKDVVDQRVYKKYVMSPSSSAFETNLGENTFELVSSNQILHVCADSPEDLASWIYNIRRAVSCAAFDISDPLFQHALLKIDDDVIYEAHFATKQPLGVIFERSGDWAITKTSTKQEVTNITVGSVLSSINGESVVTSDYFTTVNKLRGWNPPLTLTFRSVPRKEEYLLKDSRSKSNVSKRVWKKRFFILAEGKLAYKDKHTDPMARVELPLMGSGVALVDPKKIGGKNHVFKVLSGVVSILIQCSSARQMMDWASTLFHAIAIANGGSYIIDYEVDRFLADFNDNDSDTSEIEIKDPMTYRRLCESAKRKLFIAVQSCQVPRLENTLAIVRHLPINEEAEDPLTTSVIVAVKSAEDLLTKLRAAHPLQDPAIADTEDISVVDDESNDDNSVVEMRGNQVFTARTDDKDAVTTTPEILEVVGAAVGTPDIHLNITAAPSLDDHEGHIPSLDSPHLDRSENSLGLRESSELDLGLDGHEEVGSSDSNKFYLAKTKVEAAKKGLAEAFADVDASNIHVRCIDDCLLTAVFTCKCRSRRLLSKLLSTPE